MCVVCACLCVCCSAKKKEEKKDKLDKCVCNRVKYNMNKQISIVLVHTVAEQYHVIEGIRCRFKLKAISTMISREKNEQICL